MTSNQLNSFVLFSEWRWTESLDFVSYGHVDVSCQKELCVKSKHQSATRYKAYTVFKDNFCSLILIFSVLQCQKPFKEEDIIILNPSEADEPTMRSNMEARRLANKGKSKAQKREAGETDKKTEKGKKLKTEPAKDSKIAEKLLKLENSTMSNMTLNKKPAISVAKDPKASEVFKSIFTTHEKAKNQTKGHWVTYNPFYNWISVKCFLRNVDNFSFWKWKECKQSECPSDQ